MKKLEIEGQKFGRLTALRRDKQNSSGGWFWWWRCDCGSEISQRPAMVKNGHTSSCGCLRVEVARQAMTTHGLRQSDPLYNTWAKMHARCERSTEQNYANYGGRGIKVDVAWNDFLTFKTDMGPKPTPEHTLDRIDNNGNYCKTNCRWATRSEQRHNSCPRGYAPTRNMLASL